MRGQGPADVAWERRDVFDPLCELAPVVMRRSCLMKTAYSPMMLSMFRVAPRPKIATGQHSNLGPLVEPQSGNRSETATSPTAFVMRRAFESTAAMTTRDLGFLCLF